MHENDDDGEWRQCKGNNYCGKGSTGSPDGSGSGIEVRIEK